jgi:hypothetical protein
MYKQREVTEKTMRTMTEVSTNGFQEYFQKLCLQKCVTAQGNYFEGNVV